MVNTGYECSPQPTCAEMLWRAGKGNGEKRGSVNTNLGGAGKRGKQAGWESVIARSARPQERVVLEKKENASSPSRDDPTTLQPL